MFILVSMNTQHCIQIDPNTLLSPREREVLDSLKDGESSKVIARRIGLSPKTVDNHIDNIKLKVHAQNRIHLVSRCYQLGILHCALVWIMAGMVLYNLIFQNPDFRRPNPRPQKSVRIMRFNRATRQLEFI